MTTWTLTVQTLRDVSDRWDGHAALSGNAEAFQNCAFWNPGSDPGAVVVLKRVIRTIQTSWGAFEIAPHIQAVYDPTMPAGNIRMGALQRRVLGAQGRVQLSLADTPSIARSITVTSSCPDVDRIAAVLDGHCVGRAYRFAMPSESSYHKIIVKSVEASGVHLFRAGVTEIRFAERDPADLC